MGKVYSHIEDSIRSFVEKQHMFFVASAPLAKDGHVNLSPKGMDTFRVLNPNCVGYVDYYGSGIETIAHLQENQRITLCFCAFKGSPNIVRLYGKGRAVERRDEEWETLSNQFPIERGVRAIIVVNVTRVSDSCGYAVPLYDYAGQRETYVKAIAAKDDAALLKGVDKSNMESIDGLPGLRDPQGLLRPITP